MFVCLPVYPSLIPVNTFSQQRLYMLGASFSVWSVRYQGKLGDNSSQNFLFTCVYNDGNHPCINK
jgi:hypothetical protein